MRCLAHHVPHGAAPGLASDTADVASLTWRARQGVWMARSAKNPDGVRTLVLDLEARPLCACTAHQHTPGRACAPAAIATREAEAQSAAVRRARTDASAARTTLRLKSRRVWSAAARARPQQQRHLAAGARRARSRSSAAAPAPVATRQAARAHALCCSCADGAVCDGERRRAHGQHVVPRHRARARRRQAAPEDGTHTPARCVALSTPRFLSSSAAFTSAGLPGEPEALFAAPHRAGVPHPRPVRTQLMIRP